MTAEEKPLDPRDKTIEVLIKLLVEYAELNQTLLGLLTPEGKTVLKTPRLRRDTTTQAGTLPLKLGDWILDFRTSWCRCCPGRQYDFTIFHGLVLYQNEVYGKLWQVSFKFPRLRPRYLKRPVFRTEKITIPMKWWELEELDP